MFISIQKKWSFSLSSCFISLLPLLSFILLKKHMKAKSKELVTGRTYKAITNRSNHQNTRNLYLRKLEPIISLPQLQFEIYKLNPKDWTKNDQKKHKNYNSRNSELECYQIHQTNRPKYPKPRKPTIPPPRTTASNQIPEPVTKP